MVWSVKRRLPRLCASPGAAPKSPEVRLIKEPASRPRRDVGFLENPLVRLNIEGSLCTYSAASYLSHG